MEKVQNQEQKRRLAQLVVALVRLQKQEEHHLVFSRTLQLVTSVMVLAWLLKNHVQTVRVQVRLERQSNLT